jgi:hypothetical protein
MLHQTSEEWRPRLPRARRAKAPHRSGGGCPRRPRAGGRPRFQAEAVGGNAQVRAWARGPVGGQLVEGSEGGAAARRLGRDHQVVPEGRGRAPAARRRCSCRPPTGVFAEHTGSGRAAILRRARRPPAGILRRMRIDFDPEQLGRNAFYRLLTATVVPRPIAWVSTTSAAGTDNLAPATFGGKRCR